jgi:CRISPR system Cascade subunit CasE
MMIASLLTLTRADIKALGLKDAYSLHRIIYDLYEDVRSTQEKQTSTPSGILYVDKGGDWQSKRILMLADRPPRIPQHGRIESRSIHDNFLQHDQYAFEVRINPSKRDKSTGKIVAIHSSDAIKKWFIHKAPDSWGFNLAPEKLQIQNISVQTFEKKNHKITQGSASLIGQLTVLNRDRFAQSFRQGIGRGRAFGFGLLQIVPLITSIH